MQHIRTMRQGLYKQFPKLTSQSFMTDRRHKDGKEQKLIFRRWITVKGVRVYPKSSRFFPIWVDVE